MPFGIPVETYVSGQGGHVIPGGLANTLAFPVSEWQIRKMARLAESITSASGGEMRVTVLRGATVRFNVPWNSAPGSTPEVAGFREGGQLQVGFILGSGGQWYVFRMITEAVESICNSTNDIVRLTVSGYCQGVVPDPVATPP